MILEAPNGVQPLAGIGWAWGWTVFNEAAAATEATAFLDFTVVSGRIHYTPPAKPGHFTARTKPYHYTGEEQ